MRMKSDKNLPAIQTNDDDLTIDEKRDHYKKEVEKYETELVKGFKDLKRDASRLLLIAGTAFVAYKVTRFFLKSPDSKSEPHTQTPQQNTNHSPAYTPNGHISEEQETSKPKNTFSIKRLIKRKLTNLALDILKEKLQEEIIKYNKKNAK